jgi:hypothetical protein
MDKIRQFIAAGNNSEEALAKLVRWGEREEETLNERLAKDLEEVNEELARSKERFANVKDLDEMTDKELCELYEQMFGEKIGKEELPAFYNSEIDGDDEDDEEDLFGKEPKEIHPIYYDILEDKLMDKKHGL